MATSNASLGRYVYNELMKKICGNTFSAGSRLPSEERLAKEFGVSRPVVREALSQLRNEGIIESRRGAGSFLIRTTQPTLTGALRIDNWSDIFHCYEYRADLESRIAALAARRGTRSEKENIQRLYEVQKRDFFSEPLRGEQTAMDRDTAFHMAVAMATHNHFYIEALQALRKEMSESMYLIIKLFQSHKDRHFQIVAEEHGWVVNAILAGDADLAETAMRLHILNARDSLLPTETTNAQQGLGDLPKPILGKVVNTLPPEK